MAGLRRITGTDERGRFVECCACGERYCAGKAQNRAGWAYVEAMIENWWARHSGVPQTRYADLPYDNPLCEAITAVQEI